MKSIASTGHEGEGVEQMEHVQSCPTPVTLWNEAHQTPLSMGFPRQEYWSGFPFPSPGDLPSQGLNLDLPHWQVGSLPLSHLGSSGGEGRLGKWCLTSCPFVLFSFSLFLILSRIEIILALDASILMNSAHSCEGCIPKKMVCSGLSWHSLHPFIKL